MKIIVINGVAYVFSWSTGCQCRRQETLVEQALRSEKDLFQVCQWLENNGQHDEADSLLERYIRLAGRPA